MACTAGFSRLHIRHRVASGSNACGKDAVVTVSAFIHTGMVFMAEIGDTGFRHLESNLNGRFMAFVTVTLDRKTGDPFVAGSAGPTFFHVNHGAPLVVRSGVKKHFVAIVALVHLKMFSVAETGIIHEGDLLHRMTLAAIRCCSESGFPVMTGTTGLAFFHLRHGETLACHPGAEDLVVAVVTLVHSQVQ